MYLYSVGLRAETHECMHLSGPYEQGGHKGTCPPNILSRKNVPTKYGNIHIKLEYWLNVCAPNIWDLHTALFKNHFKQQTFQQFKQLFTALRSERSSNLKITDMKVNKREINSKSENWHHWVLNKFKWWIYWNGINETNKSISLKLCL